MSADTAYCDWIAVDWGTSRLRAWAMIGGTPKAETASDNGMSVLERSAFEDALLDLVEPWLGGAPMPAILCGMVGSRQGWVEAPYRQVPCTPFGEAFATPEVRDPRLVARVVPGLKQEKPADVMRGEETQIAGLLAARPNFDGVVCLPGTHTKWAEISAGEVVSFRSFMTGELFALLGERSVLRHTLDGGWDADAFGDAIGEAMSKPEALAARLFGLRAEGLLTGHGPGAARARLSGYLIGAELAAAKPYWLGREVVVIGEGEQAQGYVDALALQGVEALLAKATECTLAGLDAARVIAGKLS